MSFDSIAVAAVADELRARALDGRVQKIVQADEHTFGLELYSGHERRWLLLSADPQDPRIHLSREKVGRAEITTPLLLLLKKHLRGARLVAVEQPDFERTLHLVFATFPGTADDDGERQIVSLDDAPRVRVIIEAIGRYSNVVLVDGSSGANGVVLECAKRVSAEINRYRVVLPRHPYVPPPPQEKAPLSALTADDVAARLATAAPKTTAHSLLVGAYAGLSPQLAREAVFRATGKTTTSAGDVGSPERLVAELTGLLAARATGAWSPSIAKRDGAVFAFAPYRLTQHATTPGDANVEVVDVDSISAAIESLYAQRERFRPVDQAREVARRPLAARRASATKKYDSLQLALASGHKAEQMRLYGETILAHIHELGRGLRSLKADGLEIEMNPARSASDNAQAYFKRYRKAKAALAGVPALLEDTRLYLEYLDEAANHLELADTAEQVRAVQREFKVIDRGRGKDGAADRDGKRGSAQPTRGTVRKGAPRGRKGRDAGPSLAGITRFAASDGTEMFVGRSGRLNDWVTFELAGPDDVWLHARGVPGAHVILRAGSAMPPEATLVEAAQVAALFSASRAATTVPVDYTRRRHVRRIREALPGLVSYTGERTIQARPELPTSVQRLG